ncbi:hypothetical protein [Bacillus paranthracis]|uniref:hypothetical protein n=2 Tax=Bacillus cereus group TaxID=86661 RepID=UPI0028465274|nr:hypothetical protein [Bacillus paranthracis]MDR4144983.1 hypothetical protein [Bacillus paranthracis]MDR4390423.1 hypothetical protein [Bacillus paranthracis]MED1078236.1 hypothetical protein [Bacillus paranthracis]
MGQLNIVDGYIDKITIIGNMKRNTMYPYLLKFLNDSLEPRIVGPYIADKPRYDRQVQIKTKDSQALVQMNSRVQEGSDFRIEFNPAKCDEQDMKFIFHMLSMVENKECTRIDFCINFHQDTMCYRLIDGRRRKEKEYRGAGGRTESIYRGSEQSDDFIKMYNKKLEQKEVKYRDIEHNWCRIEQTITGNKAKRYGEWEWFKGIKLTSGEPIFPEGIDPKDKGNAYAVINKFMDLSDYKRSYKDKLKDIISQTTYEEEFDVFEALKKTDIVSEATSVIQKLLS